MYKRQDRLSEILLFSEKEKLEFYAAGSREAADVVIIDMDQEDDGIAIAECVLEYQKNSQIIFVSGSDEYYLDVYNVDHVYFLKKPVESRLLAQALEKAGKKLDRLHGKCLVVKNKQGIYKIELSDIIYFENEKRKIHIHTVDRKISFYGKFEELLDSLSRDFYRCHNSYIDVYKRQLQGLFLVFFFLACLIPGIDFMSGSAAVSVVNMLDSSVIAVSYTHLPVRSPL